MKKIYNAFLLITRIMILILMIINLNNLNYLVTLFSALILTFYDKLLMYKLNINTNYILKILVLFLIFGAQALGTVLGFYNQYIWWDIMLHTLSGFIFFYAGIEIWNYINKENIILKICFAFLISIFCAVIWEFFEFGMDYFFSTNMQITQGLYGKHAIKDTMIDMLVATLGAVLGIILYKIKKKE